MDIYESELKDEIDLVVDLYKKDSIRDFIKYFIIFLIVYGVFIFGPFPASLKILIVVLIILTVVLRFYIYNFYFFAINYNRTIRLISQSEKGEIILTTFPSTYIFRDFGEKTIPLSSVIAIVEDLEYFMCHRKWVKLPEDLNFGKCYKILIDDIEFHIIFDKRKQESEMNKVLEIFHGKSYL